MANLTKKAIAVVTCGLTLAATMHASEGTARADEVSPTGKGIVGGALLGGEIVTIPMALFNVKSGWAYAIGGGLGMIGGGVGGFAIERASFSSDGRVPIYMLAGGMALIIPAVVLILNATRYEPNEHVTEDKAPTNAPEANPGTPGGSAVIGGSVSGGAGAGTAPPPPPGSPPQPSQPATAPASPTPPSGTTPQPGGGGATPPSVPLSLVDWHQGHAVRMGVPVIEVRETYTMAERKQYGLPQGTELRMPLLRGTF